LGLSVRDLFYGDKVDEEARRAVVARRQRRERSRVIENLRADALREAEMLIRSARGICIDSWSDEHLHAAMNRLADAYELLEKEHA
jgi:hypothetical protein